MNIKVYPRFRHFQLDVNSKHEVHAGHVRRDDITTCCHKLKIEKYALKNTPRMSMFIHGVFSWRRRHACSLLATYMQGVDAGVPGVDPGMQGVDALHTASTPGMCTCTSMEAATL